MVTCRRALLYLLELPFFGLNLEYRNFLFTQIHEIVFHGNGGYDWWTVYNMPIWLRRLTFHKLQEHYEKVNDPNKGKDVVSQNRKTIQSAGISSEGQKINVPSYVVKASKK